jgi:hypothetical protein
MKVRKLVHFLGLRLFSIVLVLAAVNARAADPASLRLAIGPFFAPPDNEPLQKAAVLLPDLLTVSLSRQNQFQLVERQKVSEVWRELNLTINGMNSAAAMLKLGRVLACDQFVTGTFVVAKTNAQLWITVIDTHTGVLTDLELLPFNATNLDASLEAIASFLNQARTRNPQQFIALGRFLDLSISSAHEDWSDRLRALIGKHFVDAGYGVVDNETVAPIFEEFQLEQAGLSESQTNRVKFQPSFWLIEGRCKWVRDTEDRLSVAVRVRKLGIGEKEFQFRALPGTELASNICAAIEKDLTANQSASLEQAAREEANISNQELMEAMRGRTLLPPTRYSTNAARLDDRQVLEQKQAIYKQEGAKRAQRALLLDPNNLQAKKVIAKDYFSETNDPALQERGRQMLEELSTCTNAAIAYQSYYILAHGISTVGAKGLTLIVKPVRAVDTEREAKIWHQSMKSMVKGAESRFAANTNDLDAKFALASAYFIDLDDVTNRLRGMQMLEELMTNVNPHARDVEFASNILANGMGIGDWKGDSILVKSIKTPAALTNFNPEAREKLLLAGVTTGRPAFTVIDAFSEQPFRVLPDAGWLISKGTKLSFYNPQGEKTEVACPAKYNITALAADKDFWWVGTEGDGLIRISKSGNPPKIWTEADGLLIPAISALCCQGDRLWVGFNFHGSGGLGYLDVKTGKFVGVQQDANFSTPVTNSYGPGDAPVTSIQAADEKSIWVKTIVSLQQRDSLSGRVLQTIPLYSDVLSIHNGFLAASAQGGQSSSDIGGVKILNLASNLWTKVELSDDESENDISALCPDGQRVWAAGHPQNTAGDSFVTLVDLPSSKILARYAFKNVAWIDWIGVSESDVWFLAGLGSSETKLYRFEKPTAASSFMPSKSAVWIAPETTPRVFQTADDERLEFLQKNFSNFVPVQFHKGANGEAAIQYLHFNENKFGYLGRNYCGFKFTVPAWLDGDFEWLYILAKTEANKDFNTKTMQWYIIHEHGRSGGFDNYDPGSLANYPLLQRQFPYTHTLITQNLAMNRLEPGKTYAIWFGFQEKAPPDIAFAMTINSERGTNEFGALPLR